MKRLLYILYSTLIVTGCEDVIDVDVPNGTPKLVIDASLEFTTRDDGSLDFRLGEDRINLSLSTPFFNQEKSPVTDATVFLSNTTSNTDLAFQHIDAEPGTYIPANGSSLWKFDGDETEINITFTDNGNRDDFYLFDFDYSLYLPSEDRFYQGQSFNFSYFYEDMKAGQEITIKILGIEKRYFEYMELLVEQSERTGNPFQTPPAY